MGKQKLIKYSDGVYHVNAKTNNSEWFPIPLQECWHIFGHYLNEMSIKYNIKIYAFTLMSNHFHLLCSTPDENLDKAMHYFMLMTSKGLSLAAGRKNHLYGSRYFWTHASCPIGYAALYKYVLRNPVRAKICNNIQFYSWTTFHTNGLKFPLSKSDYEELVPKDYLAKWINSCPDKFDETIFLKILKRKKFKEPTLKTSRRKIVFDDYLAKV